MGTNQVKAFMDKLSILFWLQIRDLVTNQGVSVANQVVAFQIRDGFVPDPSPSYTWRHSVANQGVAFQIRDGFVPDPSPSYTWRHSGCKSGCGISNQGWICP